MWPISKKPDGVNVSGLVSKTFNTGEDTHGRLLDRAERAITSEVWTLTVSIARDVVLGAVGSWLYDYLKQYRAKRIRVNGREAANDDELKEIIRKEIEIGKND